MDQRGDHLTFVAAITYPDGYKNVALSDLSVSFS